MWGWAYWGQPQWGEAPDIPPIVYTSTSPRRSACVAAEDRVVTVSDVRSFTVAEEARVAMVPTDPECD